MFGYSLSRKEERAVLELLGLVATADREVSKAEKQYVVELSHDFDVSAEGIFKLADEKTVSDVAGDFDSETARKLALVYLIRLSFVDGMYQEDEWLDVREIADTMKVQEGEVADLEDWVKRGLEWEEEGRSLLGRPSKWPV